PRRRAGPGGPPGTRGTGTASPTPPPPPGRRSSDRRPSVPVPEEACIRKRGEAVTHRTFLARAGLLTAALLVVAAAAANPPQEPSAKKDTPDKAAAADDE